METKKKASKKQLLTEERVRELIREELARTNSEQTRLEPFPFTPPYLPYAYAAPQPSIPPTVVLYMVQALPDPRWSGTAATITFAPPGKAK